MTITFGARYLLRQQLTSLPLSHQPVLPVYTADQWLDDVTAVSGICRR